jgi:hypothetical protein
MALKKELDMFEGRDIDLSSDSKQWEEVNPLTALTDHSSIIEFALPESESHTDLSLTFLEVRGSIRKSDGTNFGDADPSVTCVNFPLASMFKECTVYLKNTQVSRTEHLYAYKAMLHLLLYHKREELESQFTSGGFYGDTAGYMDSVDVVNGGNEGLKDRYAQFRNRVRLCGPIFNEMFVHQGKLLPPNVPIKLRFVRQTNPWMLMSNTDDQNLYSFSISNMVIHVLRRYITPDITTSQEANALKYNASFKFPILRRELTTFSISQHDTRFVKSNIFQGEIADCMYIMMVNSEAFNGHIKKNPFNFEHFNMRSLDIRVDGKSVTGTPLDTNLQDDDAMRAVYLTYLASGREMTWFTRDMFKGGYFIIGVDLTPDHAAHDDSHRKPKKAGNVTIVGSFAQPLAHNVEVIIVAEYRSLIEIDHARNVIKDF